MNTVMPQEQLEELFDAAVREVTQSTAGVHLYQGTVPPEGELCTVYITFKNGFHSSLSLCADTAILTRMAKNMLQVEQLTPQDVEEFSKEYFNILCGQIATLLFQTTKVASRFDVPTFHLGRYEPEDHQKQFTLSYSSDQLGSAQLIHHVPQPYRQEDCRS